MSPGLQCNKKESYLWLLQKKGLFSSSSALAKLFTNLWTDESCLQKNISASFCAYWMLLSINQSPLPNLIDNEFSFVFVAWNYLSMIKKLNSSANIVLIYAHRKLTDVAKISSNKISSFLEIKKETWQMQKMPANLVLNSIKKNGKSISMC